MVEKSPHLLTILTELLKAMYMFLNDNLPPLPLWSDLLFPFTGEKITRNINSAIGNWFRIANKI